MAWANWIERILNNAVAIVGVVCILLALDKVKAYEKLRNWFRPQLVPHKRIDDEEGESHFHQRENKDGLKAEIESLRRVAELNLGRISALEGIVKDDHAILEKHMTKEAEEDIVIGILKNEQEHLRDSQKHTDANVEKIFGMFSGLKDSFIELHKTMIEMGIGKK